MAVPSPGRPPSVRSRQRPRPRRLLRQREHAGYGCDEGPARFDNAAVRAAYGDRRFYYVLTHTRGIPPPFDRPLTLVAHVDDQGMVHPLRTSALETLQAGLPPVTDERSARNAAAAVLMLAMGDPSGRRWNVTAGSLRAERRKRRWSAAYEHGDAFHVSTVSFDRKGRLAGLAIGAPPVP